MSICCEKCKKEHDGSYGSGRFCSVVCANTRVISEEQKKLASARQKITNTYSCITCGIVFTGKIRNDRLVKCKSCRKERVVNQDAKSIFDLSKRTISKILKRASVKCSMCSWDETSLDIHHIVERKNGGTDEHGNLIALCPNCHRKAHEKKYTREQLEKRSFQILLPDWKKYYNL